MSKPKLITILFMLALGIESRLAKITWAIEEGHCGSYKWCKSLSTKDEELQRVLREAATLAGRVPFAASTPSELAELEKLIVLLREAVKRWPKVGVVHAALAEALRDKSFGLRQGNTWNEPLLGEGLDHLRKAYGLDPEDPDIIFALYMDTQNRPERLSLIRKYYAKRPGAVDATRYLVYELVEAGQLDEAIQVLKQGAARSEGGKKFKGCLDSGSYWPLKEKIEADPALVAFVENTPEQPHCHWGE